MAKKLRKIPFAESTREPLPPLVMVVDEDLVIHELNPAARAFLGSGYAQALGRRSGEAFDCVQCGKASRSCGRGRFCQLCPIREAASEAGRLGQVVRRRTRAELGEPGRAREAHLLITATPLPSRRSLRVLLVFEDISDLMRLQEPAPICAFCKRVRDDEAYWEDVQVHFRRHFDLDISHGTCPECARQFYGHLVGKQSRRPVKSSAAPRAA